MAEIKGNSVLCASVGQPIPVEGGLGADGNAGHIRLEVLQQTSKVRGQLMVKLDDTVLVHDANVHDVCMQVDAAIILFVNVNKFHKGLLLRNVVCGTKQQL